MARKKDLGGGFQIISKTDSTTHGGYVTGTLNLNDISAVLIDDDEATIDLGAIHGKSKAERGIKFIKDPDLIESELPNAKTYYIVWVAVSRGENGPYYAGIADCTVAIDRATRRGFKNMAEHVNQMDAAIKRKTRLRHLDDRAKKALKTLLMTHDEQMWHNTPEETKEVFAAI
ncbi:YwhD family protein [Numidum massiliense]|uniref:YwhD family protein n=1 Tax=Numidum massiliense TaxID=1522315 RepID=UPI0006D57874|nr:YwhD family protein [Numidum massiliense]